jgi:restriction system protein
MAIPDFQSITLPLLRIAGDGGEHQLGPTVGQLADLFELDDEERHEMLPSGRQSRFANRVGWAKTYLTKAGLLHSERRGSFTVTDEGRKVLSRPPTRIDIPFLLQYPGVAEFRTPGPTGVDEPRVDERAGTPEELIEAAHQELQTSLATDLLEQVKTRSFRFFESLVVDLLVRMGYGGSRSEAGQRIGRTGDGGVDGVINEDKLGLDVVYLQAKRWADKPVRRPDIQAFAGSLEGFRARKGVFITTSRFTDDALDYVRYIEKRIVLIDGERLTRLMIEYGVGVAEIANYSVKRIALDELDYFDAEAPLSNEASAEAVDATTP